MSFRGVAEESRRRPRNHLQDNQTFPTIIPPHTHVIPSVAEESRRPPLTNPTLIPYPYILNSVP